MSDESTHASLATAIQALQDIASGAGEVPASEVALKALGAIMARRMGVPVGKPGPGRLVVEIPSLAPESGRKGWVKWVMETDARQRGGFMFEGPFLNAGKHYLPRGSIVLFHSSDLTGGRPAARAICIGEDPEHVVVGEAQGKHWAREISQPIAKYLAGN